MSFRSGTTYWNRSSPVFFFSHFININTVSSFSTCVAQAWWRITHQVQSLNSKHSKRCWSRRSYSGLYWLKWSWIFRYQKESSCPATWLSDMSCVVATWAQRVQYMSSLCDMSWRHMPWQSCRDKSAYDMWHLATWFLSCQQISFCCSKHWALCLCLNLGCPPSPVLKKKAKFLQIFLFHFLFKLSACC